jgi:hypothetical protein
MFYFLIAFIILLNRIFSGQVFAQSFQFTIPNNNISFSKPGTLEIKQNFNFQLFQENSIKENTNLSLISQNQQFLLTELFNSQLEIEINTFYSIEFSDEGPLAIVFEYLIESEEDLLAFDEPAFYINLESKDNQELIFAKTIAQSGNQWKKVLLDLRNYELEEKKLVFYAGNLINQEKKTLVYLRNLSSQVIIWHDDDRLFVSGEEILNINDYLDQSHIEINDQIWPIYQFAKTQISGLEIIREFDNSLTLLFSPIEDDFFKNHQCTLICDEDKKQLLKQINYFLLPQITINDFWPNLDDKVLLNVADFPCTNLSKVSVECF